MLIVGVDALLCSFQLPAPVRLGAVTYTSRDYVTARVRTEDGGLVGYAAGATRGTPLLPALQLLADGLVGTDLADHQDTIHGLVAARRTARAALVRAVSVLEMSLWDAVAKAAEAPFYKLAAARVLEGPGRNRADLTLPAMAVCGYFLDERGEGAIIDDLVRLEADGFVHLKLMLGYRDPDWMIAFLSKARHALRGETRLGVDLHYSSPDFTSATALIKRIDDLDLAFVEDPLEPTQWRDLAQIGNVVRTPIAAGEDVVAPVQYLDILESATVLRVDPSTCGGLSAALEGLTAAHQRRVPVIPHGFSGNNAYLAACYPGTALVEVIPPEISSDGFDAFMRPAFTLRDGHAVLSDSPGTGLDLDWAGLSAIATEAWTAGSAS